MLTKDVAPSRELKIKKAKPRQNPLSLSRLTIVVPGPAHEDDVPPSEERPNRSLSMSSISASLGSRDRGSPPIYTCVQGMVSLLSISNGVVDTIVVDSIFIQIWASL